MDEELIPMQNDCDSSDLSVDDQKTFGNLPYLCLHHIFSFLDDQDRMNAGLACRHWHTVMHSPSLWRHRFFHFSGRQCRERQSDYSMAVSYAQSLGAYLQSLEVYVMLPCRPRDATRLENAISGLLSELTRVNAPLRSISITGLELDSLHWPDRLRRSLVTSLSKFLQRGGSALTNLCLRGMRNDRIQGLQLLSALACSQCHLPPHCGISSLDLRGFFSCSQRDKVTQGFLLSQFKGLTHLSLSYSCVSDSLLLDLQQRQQEWRSQPSRDGTPLQTLTIHCSVNEPHRHVPFGRSCLSLVCSCPDLKVKFTVDRVFNTDSLSRILRPEIPMTEFNMAGFYFTYQEWSATPILRDLLPQYRYSLQYLALDMRNRGDSLDEELLELVKVCECLKEFHVRAFLDMSTVSRLLHIRLHHRSSLNKIRVRIYTMNDNNQELKEQLEQILSCNSQLPPELDFDAAVCPFL